MTTTTHRSGHAPAVEHKALPAGGAVVKDVKTGVVEAIVSVTGIVDEVKDNIAPGAYAKTLTVRKPKGVYSHDWDQPIAKTLEVVELMPGDPYFTSAEFLAARKGKPWPKQAGGLKVRMQFNLGTSRGRDAFAEVEFYEDEQEWSIGYNVPPGGARLDSKTGVRHINVIDLFEYSPVLFGAAPLAGTTSIKAIPRPGAEPGADAEAQLEEVEDGGDDALAPHAFRDVEEGDDPDECGICHLPRVAHEAQVDPDLQNPDGSPLEGAGLKGSRAPLDRSPKHNWVEDAGGLPGYVREVARSISEKRGVPLSRAIHIAIGVIQRWARGGGDVDADTRAKAAAAVAEWEKLKATNRARQAAKTLEAKGAGADHSASAMVALYPPPEVAQQLAVANGLPAEELHVTLAFLGDAAGIDRDAVVEAVRATVPECLTGHVRGLGMWPTEDGDCWYRPVDVPGMDQWRPRLLAELASVGAVASNTHSHSPHMAVSYVDPVSRADAPDVDDVPWTVAVEVGPDRTTVATERKDVHTGSVAPVVTGGFGGGPDRPPMTRQGRKRCGSCKAMIPAAAKTCPECGKATAVKDLFSEDDAAFVADRRFDAKVDWFDTHAEHVEWAVNEVKVGRVLSAVNLAKLQAARDALDAVLATAEAAVVPADGTPEEKRRRKAPSRAMTALERVHRIPVAADGPTEDELAALARLRADVAAS